MRNTAFFSDLFPAGYWDDLRRSSFPTDAHNMFGDSEVFELLIEKFRPEFIIEVGSWKGHSANFMADVTKRLGLDSKIICVDTFLGAPEHWLMPDLKPELHLVSGRPTIIDRFIGNTIARGNDGIIYPLPLDSSAAAQVFRQRGFSADLIFIDAAHDYENVTRDLTNYLPLLSERGVMFGDDYQYFEVANAVHDFAKANNLKVLVAARKWMFYPDWLIARDFSNAFVARSSFEGWVHP